MDTWPAGWAGYGPWLWLQGWSLREAAVRPFQGMILHHLQTRKETNLSFKY